MVTSKSLVLTFKTDNNEEVKVTINSPAEDLEAADISAAMDQMVAAGALGEENLVTTKVSANYVIKQVEEVALS